MNYPKPDSLLHSNDGITKAGAWHNYFLDNLWLGIATSGVSAKNPAQGRRVVDGMLSSEDINATEHDYLCQYIAAYSAYYSPGTDFWARGYTHLPDSLAQEIKAIHSSASISPAVTSDIFKTISNITLGSSEYWNVGGSWTPPDPTALSIVGIAFGDLMGGVIGYAIGKGVNHTGWDLVADTVIGAAVTSFGLAVKGL